MKNLFIFLRIRSSKIDKTILTAANIIPGIRINLEWRPYGTAIYSVRSRGKSSVKSYNFSKGRKSDLSTFKIIKSLSGCSFY